jgi:hypothetical protein
MGKDVDRCGYPYLTRPRTRSLKTKFLRLKTPVTSRTAVVKTSWRKGWGQLAPKRGSGAPTAVFAPVALQVFVIKKGDSYDEYPAASH